MDDNKKHIRDYLSDSYRDKIEALRRKHPSTITEADRAEIRALRTYFHPHELQALGVEDEPAAEQAPEAPEPPKPARRAKRAAEPEPEE
jgi:hypothetical protein